MTRFLLLPLALVFAACQDTSPAAPAADTHGGMDHAAMGHDGGAPSSYTDVRLLDEMIHHHEMAVQMAEMARAKAQSADVKVLAEAIVRTQTAEVDSMRAWRQRWHPTAPATEMDADAMARMGMPVPMDSLRAATGATFDARFLADMIAHHAGAVVMAAEAQVRSERPEIRRLADAIIRAQAAEIGQMQAWRDRR